MISQPTSSARARTTSTDSTSKTNDDDTVFFETITMTKFDKFQAEIFPIVSKITTLKQYQDHPFAVLWKQAIEHPGNTFNENSTLRSIHKLLPVENLQDYRRFLLECPTLNNYVTFKDSAQTTAGFEVYFNEVKIKQLLRKNDDEHGTKDEGTDLTSFNMLADGTVDPSRSDTVTTDDQENYLECFGSRTDFRGLWTQVCFILNTFAVESPDDEITTKWKKWQQTGLNIRSDLQKVKRIMNLDSLSDLFCFLRDCPPVSTFLDLKWDNKIMYRRRQEPIYKNRNAVQLIDIAKSTPSARLHNWRSTLRFAYILEINGRKIDKQEDVTNEINKARQAKMFKLNITFATERKYGIHPMDRNLQLHFDQMNSFAKHIYESEQEYRAKLKELQGSTAESTVRATIDQETKKPTQTLEKASRENNY